jgi:RHS repeat-associated protein
MTSTDQRGSRSEACFASGAVSSSAKTGPRNPQPSYYRARYYNPQLQRFISEDPLGTAAGPNVYQYAGSSPSNFTDPLGLIYGLSQSSDGTITITVPISIYGDGATALLAKKWQDDINAYWNGHTWKKCKVVVDAPITVDQGANHFDLPTINLVKVVGKSGYRSNTVLFFGWGWWALDEDRYGVAHEFGHLMDLGDKYSGDVPDPGFETDIMGSALGVVRQDTLDRVLAGRACGCKN